MHPIDRKSYIYASIIIVWAIIMIILSIILNFYYAAFYVPFIVYALTRKKLNLKQKLVLFSLSIDVPSIFVLAFVIQSNDYDFAGSIAPMAIFSVFMAIIIKPIYSALLNILKAANYEKKHYKLIRNYPHLVCKKHLTKTEFFIDFGYKVVHCRKDNNCLEANNLKVTKGLVGIIGPTQNENYDYHEVVLWDNQTEEITNGDYDIIKIIGANEQMDYDYDYIITKVVNFLYNELNRYKPINKVVIEIIGQPEISESTRRLLEEKFLKVEYASNG